MESITTQGSIKHKNVRVKLLTRMQQMKNYKQFKDGKSIVTCNFFYRIGLIIELNNFKTFDTHVKWH